MGQGTWTASSQEPVCINFYDPDVSEAHSLFVYLYHVEISLSLLFTEWQADLLLRAEVKYPGAEWILWTRKLWLSSETSLSNNYYTRELSTLRSHVNSVMPLRKKYSFQEIVDFVKVWQIKDTLSRAQTRTSPSLLCKNVDSEDIMMSMFALRSGYQIILLGLNHKSWH